MSLPKAFQPFVEGAPSAVITRLALEYLVDDKALGMLFADHATAQYEREVTLTNLVNVMLDVACGARRSPRAAFQARGDQIAASLSAFYGKLQRTELGISEAIVAHSGKKAGQLIRAMKGLDAEPVPGFPSYVLDGNMLTGTEHRLKPLRNTRAAASLASRWSCTNTRPAWSRKPCCGRTPIRRRRHPAQGRSYQGNARNCRPQLLRAAILPANPPGTCLFHDPSSSQHVSAEIGVVGQGASVRPLRNRSRKRTNHHHQR